MTRKNKLRTAPKPRLLKTDPAISQAFLEIDELSTREYLENKKRYRDAEESLIAQLQKVIFRDPKFLKRAREEMKLSQADIANMTGISPSAIGNYEAGIKAPTLDNAYQIYKVLFALGSVDAATALDEIMSIFIVNLLGAREKDTNALKYAEERIKVIDFNLEDFGAEQKRYKDRIEAAFEKRLAVKREEGEQK